MVIDNIHKGHRQRLKDKVRQGGLFALQKHEMLELLLTYTIPQKDTNPLAHNLLNTFSSLANVFDAGYTELKKQDGVGEETALFLSLLPQLFEAYKQDKFMLKDCALKSTEDCVIYFRKNYEIGNIEKFYLVCLNSLNRIVLKKDIEGLSDSRISIDPKAFLSNFSNKNVTNIIIYHTHPHGDVLPSDEDLLATEYIIKISQLMNVKVNDHIILSEQKHYSMGANKIIEKLENKLFGDDVNKEVKINLMQKNFSYKDSFAEAVYDNLEKHETKRKKTNK